MRQQVRRSFGDGWDDAAQDSLPDSERGSDGDGDRPDASRLTRRSALGVLAAGAAMAACGSRSDDPPLASVTPDGVDPLTQGSTRAAAPADAKPVVLEVDLDATTQAMNDELATVKLDTPLDGPTGGPSSPFDLTPQDTAPQDPASIDDAPADNPPADSAPMDDVPDTSTEAPTTGDTPTGDSSMEQAAPADAPPADDGSMPADDGSMPMDTASMDTGAMDDPASMNDGSDVLEVTVDDPAPASPTTTPERSPTTAAAPADTTPSTTAAAAPVGDLQPVGNGALTAALVVNKLTFGPKQGQIAQVEASGPAAFVEDQLRRTGPDPAVEATVKAIKPIHYSPKQCRDVRLRSWWMSQYVAHVAQYRNARSEHQLYEMMCHTWMDHFNVFVGSDRPAYFIPEYQEKVIRPNAMGSFRDLLKATANSAAMMTYLDNRLNDASKPSGINENYGRELLELHTLGIDRNERKVYNEQDVRTVSTVMGGWAIETDDKLESYGRFLYRPELAYTGPDLSILNGAWSTAGRTGKARGDALLDFLATHPSTARNVALRLCIRFVSDNPSQGLVDSTAKVFLDNDTAIVPVLRHIFDSDEFARSGGLKFRRPMEYEAALFRFVRTNMEVADYEGNDARSLRWYMKTGRLHEPWRWQQPDGFPDSADHWIKTDGFYRRWHDANYAARGARWGNDIAGLMPTLAGRSAAGVVQEIATQLGIGRLPDDEVATIIATVGLDPDSPEVTINVRHHLQPITALVMSHPRFQTR